MRLAAYVVGLLLAVSGTAFAQDSLAKFLPKKEGATACFRRVYDSAHLAKHKDQTVVEMGFRISYVVARDEDYGEGASYYAFQLLAKRKGDERELKADGVCSETKGRIFCGVECDGGGLYLKSRGEKSILLDFGESDGILMSVGCTEDEGTEVLRPGKDDKSFRLDRLQASHCPAYGFW